MKWAKKFGWGIGSRFISAFLQAVKKKKPRHEEIFEEAAEIHAQQFADGIDADVLQSISDIAVMSYDLVPYNNHRNVWKQNRIDILMTHNAFYSKAQNNVFVPDSLWGEK